MMNHLVCKMLENSAMMAISKSQRWCLVCPGQKYKSQIQFILIENREEQQIFTFEELKQENV